MVPARRAVEIVNEHGLHLRAAERFVRLARRFEAHIEIHCGDDAVDGKSILDLLTLAAATGARLDVAAIGVDAEAAVAALWRLAASGFDESCAQPPSRQQHRDDAS
jgi:phosphocarrier protein